MERPRLSMLSRAGLAIATAFHLGGQRAESPARPEPQRRPPSTRATKRAVTPHQRRGSMQAATDYLGKRTLRPDSASNIRKLQRAFRLAGRSFTPGRG